MAAGMTMTNHGRGVLQKPISHSQAELLFEVGCPGKCPITAGWSVPCAVAKWAHRFPHCERAVHFRIGGILLERLASAFRSCSPALRVRKWISCFASTCRGASPRIVAPFGGSVALSYWRRSMANFYRCVSGDMPAGKRSAAIGLDNCPSKTRGPSETCIERPGRGATPRGREK
jgi:hypothetical protein